MSYIPGHVPANKAMAKLFYFCDYDGVGFEFSVDSKHLHSYVKESLDPIFKALQEKSFEEYAEQKRLFLEYLDYRVANLKLDEHSKKDFENAVCFFRNIYFPRIEK